MKTAEEIRERYDRCTLKLLNEAANLTTAAVIYIQGGDRCLAESNIMRAQELLNLAYGSNVDAYRARMCDYDGCGVEVGPLEDYCREHKRDNR